MSTSTPSPCPSCGADTSGNFCSGCGASLTPRSCASCHATLSARARFCHRCGHPVSGGSRSPRSERRAWAVAAVLCLLLVGGIVYKVSGGAPAAPVPDMANTGADPRERSAGQSSPTGEELQGRAPDISTMTPRERFDRLFNRIMQAGERRDSVEVQRFTPMALGAYQQLDEHDIDARYHAAVLYIGVGDFAPAYALADSILGESPHHLFGSIIRGTAAGLQGDPAVRTRAEREFLRNYTAEMAAKRVEYL